MHFDNFDVAKESFAKNQVDYIILTKNKDVESILKKSKPNKVGIVSV